MSVRIIVTYWFPFNYIITRIERRGSACQLGRQRLSCLAAHRPGPTCPELGFPSTAPHKARWQRQWRYNSYEIVRLYIQLNTQYANPPDNQALPQLWVMLIFGPAVDQLRSDNVSHRISHEDCGCHDSFLGGTSHIAGANGNDKANHRAKEASERIARDRRSWVISPL